MATSIHPITGCAVGSFRTPYFGVTEAAYPAHYTLPPHGHATATLTFVLRGELEEKVAGRSERFGPRGFLLKPVGMAHSDRFGAQGARLLLVEILPALAEAAPAVRRVLDNLQPTLDPRLGGLLIRVAQELRHREACAEICAEGLLLELMAGLGRTEDRATGRGDRHLERVRDRLHAEFGRRLRIGELAAAEGISPTRLSRGFRARFGQGVGAYLRQVRLSWVAETLVRTDESISALAVAAGFTDQSHLTRDFRAAYGLTPAAFRRSGTRPSGAAS